MAHLHEGCDPSSSLDKNMSRRKALGLIGGAVAAASLVACGQGEHRPTPENDPSSVTSLSPSESPSASASSSETVDPEVLARMQAREKYDKRVKQIDKIPYNEFIKLSPEQKREIIQIEIDYMEESGRAKDLSDSIFYPKDSLPFGSYYKSSDNKNSNKIFTDAFLPVVFALYGRFTYTDSSVKANYKEYAKKMISLAFVNPQVDMDILRQEALDGKISSDEGGAKRQITELIEKRAEQIRSNSSGNDVTLWNLRDLEIFFDTEKEVTDPRTGQLLKTLEGHYYSYEGNKRGSAPIGGYVTFGQYPNGNWQIAGFPLSGPVLSK